MALSKFSRKSLSERYSLKLKNRRKHNCVHALVNKDQLLESSTISIGTHPDKFKDYVKISKETFDTLLKRPELSLCKPGTDNRESIFAEQLLVVAVR